MMENQYPLHDQTFKFSSASRRGRDAQAADVEKTTLPQPGIHVPAALIFQSNVKNWPGLVFEKVSKIRIRRRKFI